MGEERLLGPAASSVRGAPPEVAGVCLAGALLCPDLNLLGGSHVCT